MNEALKPFPDVAVGVLISMTDEWIATCATLKYIGDKVSNIAIVQTGGEEFEHLRSAADECGASYTVIADTQATVWGKQSHTICYAYNRLIEMSNEWDVDYLCFLSGDTVVRHIHGIHWIIEEMGVAELACSRGVGLDYHTPNLTEEQLTQGYGGGRYQEQDTRDFMAQMFILKIANENKDINFRVTNQWTVEQCLGDALDHIEMYSFSDEPFGFHDGIIYQANQKMQVTKS